MAAVVRCVHRHRVGVGLRLLMITLVATTAVAGPSPARAAPCWFPPVAGVVADPYREPPCPWCAGNRGLDYRVGADVTVTAAASGRVVFAGTVVDVHYVVVRLASGWRHTYGHLSSTSLGLGDVVFAGGVVGRAANTFSFGLRIGDDYADPAPFIGVLRSRPRLIPLDATPARPAPRARPRCP